jgi:hypothetical protein
MTVSKVSEDSAARVGKLRNFDLSVEEIRILKAISDMTRALEEIERKNPQPARMDYYRSEIRQLEDQLEEVRENTLIR